MKYDKIRRSWQFEKVYKEGSKYFDDLFVLYALPNNIGEVRICAAAAAEPEEE
ncbi:MAG: ribonuclease P protein component, partial [Candidatus Poribacteria bacterium]